MATILLTIKYQGTGFFVFRFILLSSMSSFTRLQVYQTLLENPIMPIFFHDDPEVCKRILTACYEGGIRCCEFTNRGDYAHETYGALRKFSRQQFPDMVIGAGTLVEAPTTALYIQLGADFIVSPTLHEDVGRLCNRRKIGWLPGCFTLSEISKAEELGVEFVKLFPGQASSPDFIRAIHGPMPWTRIIVTGGVEPTADSLRAWLGAGATGVGIGSQLFPKQKIKDGAWDDITATIENAVRLAHSLRK